jgi:alkylhydroperoxidase family enzyme
MARLPYLNKEDLPEEHQRLLERPGNLFRVLVHSPEGFRNFSRLGGWIRNISTLDSRLRELAILQVGYLTGCEYEYTHHIKLAREQFGVSDDDVRAIARETAGEESGLGELERAALRLAREMTTQLEGSAEAFEEVRSHLSNEHVVDLLMTIAFYNLVVRLLFTLEVDLEDEYLHLLDEFPMRGPA